jgi:hypothetical protein
MKTSTSNGRVGVQSVLFCIGIYFVCLFISIFVCSSVFYAFKTNEKTDLAQKQHFLKIEIASLK